MREFFDLANNPLFVKHFRARLRRSAVVPGLVIVAFLCMAIIFYNNFVARGVNRPNPSDGSQAIFWLQAVLLVVMGGSQVASAIAQMKESGIIDFHRITPIPPAVQTVGIMIGGPIRELIMYAVTLPFALYLAIDGPVGVTNFCKLMLAQLGAALMYYSLAMITGLTASKARGASGRYVGVLFLINIICGATLFPLKVYGPTLLTTTPVYYETFFDNDEVRAERKRIAKQRAAQRAAWQQMNAPANPPGQGPNARPQVVNPPPADDDDEEDRLKITFYGVEFPVVAQTLLFQGCVLTFLFIAASRRIHSARLPLYRKPVALLFYLTVSFLTVGSLWDTPIIGLAYGGIYFLTFFAILLTNAITPLLGDVVKGLERARKLSDMRVPLWSDLATNRMTVVGFALIMTAGLAIGISRAEAPRAKADFTPWAPLLVGVMTVLCYGFVAQYFPLAHGNRSRSHFTIFVFFAWIVPAVVGMLALAADAKEGGYLLALTPIVGIFTAGLGGGADFLPLNHAALQIASIAPISVLAVVFALLLFNQERRLAAEVSDDHDRRAHRRAEG
jgi:hypothetical protein